MIFEKIYNDLRSRLVNAPPVDVGEWHARSVKGSPLHVTRELLDVRVQYEIPPTELQLRRDVKPNLPWAHDHFMERVSGEPMNPAPSQAWWPFGNTAMHMDPDRKFSHTYPERFWPKRAGTWFRSDGHPTEAHGIRYLYGDLDDVVRQLRDNPMTRQAVLPVFFPEDTGNVSKVRVPCSLSYHFMIRDEKVNVTYAMRSVDFVRHFRDDVYMACALAAWVGDQVGAYLPGRLTMDMTSLHILSGDHAKLKAEVLHAALG